MCQGLLHLRDMDRMTQPCRDRAGEATPLSQSMPTIQSARAPCWLRANARGQGAQGCSPQNCPLCRDQGEEGEEWVWLGKFEVSRQCASYIIFMSFRPRTTLI